eukprot:6566089-Ditylum_brightwellii.AAC.1
MHDSSNKTYQGPTVSPNTVDRAEQRTYSLRPTHVLDYRHLKAQGYEEEREKKEEKKSRLKERNKVHKAEKDLDGHTEALLIHHALTQYYLKQGIQKFGKGGEDTVVDEFTQLHEKD